MNRPPHAWLTACAFAAWLGVRLFVAGPVQTFGMGTAQGMLPFLFVDLSWLALLPLLAACLQWEPSERAARAYAGLLGCAAFLSHALHALTRYWRGDALAWDLGNFVQPMWRATNGLGMLSSWHGDRPLWGDHGSFALFLFAPLTRLFDDAATGLLLAQALLAALFVPGCYLLARRLGLATSAALMLTCAAFSSRALAYATSFDFHPECALPLLLVVVLWAQHERRWTSLTLAVLAAASLKDVAALTVSAACFYLAVRDRQRKTLVLGVAALLVAGFDMALLPRLTGWASYVTMNTSAPVDAATALQSTALRALGTGLAGSVHPFALVAGAPWTLAAALSPKLLVKGVQFQYGFFFVPTALLGGLLLAAWLARRTRRASLFVALGTLACVLPNAPRALPLARAVEAHDAFQARRAMLAPRVADAPIIATDACSAASLLERQSLLPLCQIDVAHFAATGIERWDVADPRALHAPLIVVQRSCTLHGGCWSAQLNRAAREGYRVVHDAQGWLVLQRAR